LWFYFEDQHTVKFSHKSSWKERFGKIANILSSLPVQVPDKNLGGSETVFHVSWLRLVYSHSKKTGATGLKVAVKLVWRPKKGAVWTSC
jgi:hypothetical protein